MATRPVFITKETTPFYSVYNADFEWAKGLALCQKRKNIDAIHRCFEKDHPDKTVLEISGKSVIDTGVSASAFNLKKYVPSLGASVPVENIYQSSKVFSSGGPYTDLLTTAPVDAKRDERLKTSGKLIAYRYEDTNYSIIPQTAFYDFIYISALLENARLAGKLTDYDGFTDIAFNPAKGINCQARAAAIYVSLQKLGLADQMSDYATFLKLISNPDMLTQMTTL